ncbi:MAG: Shikimate kinase [Prosthecobacter sp.]|nr:Shikimate kinase [Prosthecobacter sp.]
MKILLIGCGYVGERAADLLHAGGHEVLGVTHSQSSAERLGAVKPWTVLSGDVACPDAVQALRSRTGPVDAFIHCASSGRGGADAYQAVYVNGMTHLASAYPEARPLFTSSTSVYPQTDGSQVDEESHADPDRETGRLLRAAENIALGRNGLVARLAGIYGPGRSFVLKNLLEGRSGIEVSPEAPEGRLLNQIHVDDAACALVHLVTTNQAGIFNVVDDAQLTQRACLEKLAALFSLPVPETRSPDPLRKRGWSHKSVSNARLRATGWSPAFPSYFDALRHDPQLVSSILALVDEAGEVPLPRSANIVLIGLMGSGKSSVGRIVARLLGFQFVDTDHMIVDRAGCSIPEIFAREGEAGFRRRESAVLRELLGTRHSVIATGGGIITQPVNLPLLRHLGFITWLEASTDLLVRRTSSNNDRPLLRGEEPPRVKLERLIQERGPIYKAMADLRIQTDELSQEESAYGVAESARLFFSLRK